MIANRPQARVFISFGPQKDPGEVEIAHKVAERLRNTGFEPYIGVEEQTLKGLKEHTFGRLAESEYVVLIDLKNERVYRPGPDGTVVDSGKYRGSLLSHQIFAASTLLGIETLVFEEQDIKEDERISRLVEADCVGFTNRERLPDLVAEKIKEKRWNPNWRNELTLERNEKDFEDAPHISLEEKSFRYYYIRAKNLHREKIAHECVAYLERVKNLLTGEEKEYDLMEFKWKGITPNRILIPPMKERALDAFHVRYDSPSLVYFGVNPLIINYTGYMAKYSLAGRGDFELTYVLFSENFPPTKGTFKLHVGTRLDEIEFVKKSEEPGSA